MTLDSVKLKTNMTHLMCLGAELVIAPILQIKKNDAQPKVEELRRLRQEVMSLRPVSVTK